MTDPGGETGAVVLAAGASTRLGQPKQLLRYRGTTLLERTIDAIRTAIDGPVLVVTGRDHEPIRASLESAFGCAALRVARCPDWGEGMGSSLAFGVCKITEEYANLQRIIVSVCDQPHLNAEIIANLIRLHRTEPSSPAACSYGDTVGPPACFPMSDFPALMRLRGNRGAKSLLTGRPEPVMTVSFAAGAIDVDTPADYQSLLSAPQSDQNLWTSS